MKYNHYDNATTTLKCDGCGLNFERATRFIFYNRKTGNKHSYCSRKCQPRKKASLRTCLHCNKETSNAMYCSQLCSNKYNGKFEPTGKCKLCSVSISNSRTYCKPCFTKSGFRKNYDELTLTDCKKRGSNLYHATVRIHARKKAEQAGLLEACKVCGYSNFVECCHITPVKSFPESTKLSIVNSIDNLIGLCPNHHQELDAGLIKI